jgi:hypothetical protein
MSMVFFLFPGIFFPPRVHLGEESMPQLEEFHQRHLAQFG